MLRNVTCNGNFMAVPLVQDYSIASLPDACSGRREIGQPVGSLRGREALLMTTVKFCAGESCGCGRVAGDSPRDVAGQAVAAM